MLDSVIDLSRWNSVTSLQALYNDGVRGIIHKATQGLNTVDPKYNLRRQPARDAGLMFGAYHFGIGTSGKAQAKHFLDVVQPDARTLLALDFEPNSSGGTSMTIAQARDFVTHVHDETGRWPLFYSGHLVKDLLGKKVDPVLAQCPLWLAQYANKPVLQKSWSTWTLWQYTQTGTARGVTDSIDRDRFNGDEAALRQLWGYPTQSALAK